MMEQTQCRVPQRNSGGAPKRTNQSDIVSNFTTPMLPAQYTMPRKLRSHDAKMLQQIPKVNYTDTLLPPAHSADEIHRVQIDGKDLIIRMLAEVFHVSQSENGQVRWQQVSTSLVPVSLYSRTTSKWLDYMLAASTVASTDDPANAMSPDSREFILLMQKFHRSQQLKSSKMTISDCNFAQQQVKYGVKNRDKTIDQPDRLKERYEDLIVFQITGHDFIEGQCKKFLNVKLVQPGTRLGRASDYFVYWKEQPTHLVYDQDDTNHLNHVQHQFSSSFASSSSYAQQPPSALLNEKLEPRKANRWLMVNPNENGSQTWGLNFASINDAKLFYDICSLNLVDLDFNSEYLKQLALSDKLRQQSRAQSLRIATPQQNMIYPISIPARHQQRSQQKLIQNQQKTSIKPRVKRNQIESRCQQCNVAPSKDSEAQQISYLDEGKIDIDQNCPLHGASNTNGTSLRERSRSSTRSRHSRNHEEDNFYRARSFSTPASPDLSCPVHRKRYITDSECEHNDDELRMHHPECSSRVRRSYTVSKSHVPMKPARGFLRSDLSSNIDFNENMRLKPTMQYHDILTSDQVSHSGINTKTRHTGYLHSHEQRFNEPGQEFYNNVPKLSRPIDGNNLGVMVDQRSHHNHQVGTQSRHNSDNQVQHRSVSGTFANTQYMINELDTLARQDARLARARYANSKNMQEFLSLDGSRLLSTPSQQFLQFQKQPFGMKGSKISAKNVRRETRSELQQIKLITSTQVKEKKQEEKKTGKVEKSRLRLKSAVEDFSRSGDRQDCANLKNVSDNASATNILRTSDSMRNVATTTEDLPIDSHTHRRMLDLGSEETITKRNEFNGFSNVNANDNLQIEKQEEKTKLNEERQVRAVSLGPEIGQSTIRARSDTSRRRSLERSMCVDLDSTFPSGSSAKFARSSPLSLSTRIGVRENLATHDESTKEKQRTGLGAGYPGHIVEESESNGLSDTQIHQKLNGNKLKQTSNADNDMCLDGSARHSADHLRPSDNLLSKDNIVATFDSGIEGPLTRTESSRKQRGSQHGRQPGKQRMIAFKSAPDISHLSKLQRQQDGRATFSGRWSNFATAHDDQENIHPRKRGSKRNEGDEIGDQIYMDEFEQRQLRKRRIKHRSDLKTDIPQQLNESEVPYPAAQTVPKMITTLSSYEVPLCASTRRQWHQDQQQETLERQCHSCPNSLRRKRRLLNTHDSCEELGDVNDYALKSRITTTPTRSDCIGECRDCVSVKQTAATMLKLDADRSQSMNSSYRKHRSNETPVISAAQDDEPRRRMTENWQQAQLYAPPTGRCHATHCSCYLQFAPFVQKCEFRKCQDCNSIYQNALHAFHDESEHERRVQQLAHFHNHQRIVCSKGHNQSCHCPLSSEARCKLDCGAKCVSASRSMVQSTSFTSPRQLAEFKCVSNQAPSQKLCCAQRRLHNSQSVRSPLHYGLYESEYEDDTGGSIERFSRNASTLENYIKSCEESSLDQAISAYAEPPLKPVKGYDRTLARAVLKSRRRSTSQPPTRDKESNGSATAPGNDNSHLTRSMENVEKLIREVQIELNALRRNPLGTASINLRDDYDGGNKTQKGERNELTKMSFEERQDSAKNVKSDLEPTSSRNAKLPATSATRRAGQFKCVGAIRKAGFLSVKKWILKRRQSIELARRQGWKRYWVCLRGTALLFHTVIDTEKTNGNDELFGDEDNQRNDDENQTDLLSWVQANFPNQVGMLINLLRNEQQQQQRGTGAQEQPISRECLLKSMSQCYIEREPKHLIIIDGSIAQPIPEHPRRDFVFCLSTTFGDAYFFQAACQLESDNWISAIHNACAAAIARDLTRDDTIKLFESKVRQLELEAEKKLFLRQRLESRLTSTLSMSGYELGGETVAPKRADNLADEDASRCQTKKVTMRSLLYQLSQQLLALDTYIEQVHCEIYQLRCYLSSCGAQNLLYQNLQLQSDAVGKCAPVQIALATDLPHPKSLLMHVSKPTKLLLLKLGVFTVSSFHAFIHARQESAETILQTISQQQMDLKDQMQAQTSSPMELRIRSQSISEALLTRPETNKLDNETEELIELANLKTIRVQLSKDLFEKIRLSSSAHLEKNYLLEIETDTSDDRYSIRDGGEVVIVNLKVNPSLDCMAVIKQVLEIVEPNLSELDFLDYYLRLMSVEKSEQKLKGDCLNYQLSEEHYIVKRKEKLEDWPKFNYVELLQKLIYRLDLVRCRTDEEATLPFGISIEGQLFTSKFDSLLNVYCSYIEWGSAADKACLQEEDELLTINGVPVADLDLMFVECLLQDATKLRLVVRSSRPEHAKNATLLDRASWQPSADDDDDDDDDDDSDDDNEDDQGNDNDPDEGASGLVDAHRHKQGPDGLDSVQGDTGSQIISDEYLTSLVCPPPPIQSSAFLRTDQRLLRQRSDLGTQVDTKIGQDGDNDDMDEIGTSKMRRGMLGDDLVKSLMHKSKSQHRLDNSPVSLQPSYASSLINASDQSAINTSTDSNSLAKQLLQRTERLTRMLAKESVGYELPNDCSKAQQQLSDKHAVEAAVSLQHDCNPRGEHSDAERLRKCISELFETEYAYIRQLETINERYMAPLSEANFLNSNDLKLFKQTLDKVLKFQRQFFHSLTTEIASEEAHFETNSDDYGRLELIVQRLEVPNISSGDMNLVLRAISKIFASEAENFRVYASYCIAYSKLQRILHPKSASNSNLPSSSITSMPACLNTFTSSAMPSFGLAQQRDLLKPISNLITVSNSLSVNCSDDFNALLRRLNEFLGNLDSSSSSLSISSLARSSSTLTADGSADRETLVKETKMQKALSSQKVGSSTSLSSDHQQTASASCQKNVHQQNFESYLIKPIQRIVKYPMLLNSIVISAKSVLHNNDNEQAGLQTAVKQMETAICQVNDRQWVHDEFGSVLDNIERQYMSLMGEQQMLDHQTAALRSIGSSITLQSGPHQPPVTLDIDQLLYFGPVDWVNLHEFTMKSRKSSPKLNQVLFVFSSCVVFVCKEPIKSTKSKLLTSLRASTDHGAANQQHSSQSNGQTSSLGHKLMQKSIDQQCTEIIRYQTLIPVSEVQVRSVPSDSRSHSASSFKSSNASSLAGQFHWELFQCSSSNSNSNLLTNRSGAGGGLAVASVSAKRNQINKNGRVYQLACQTNEERSAFLRKIRFIIRESVRKMSLPLARSLSSRSFNSKKLSSPTDATSVASSPSSSPTNEAHKKDQANTASVTASSRTNSSSSQVSNYRIRTDSSCALGELSGNKLFAITPVQTGGITIEHNSNNNNNNNQNNESIKVNN